MLRLPCTVILLTSTIGGFTPAMAQEVSYWFRHPVQGVRATDAPAATEAPSDPVTETPPPMECAAPWGATVNHGASVIAYSAPEVAHGSTCVSQSRSCDDGNLSGSFEFQSCVIQDPEPEPEPEPEPPPFEFATVDGVMPGAIYSEVVTPTGFDSAVPVSISGNTMVFFDLNESEDFIESGVLSPGQSLRLAMVAMEMGTTYVAHVSVGDYETTWTVNTLPADDILYLGGLGHVTSSAGGGLGGQVIASHFPLTLHFGGAPDGLIVVNTFDENTGEYWFDFTVTPALAKGTYALEYTVTDSIGRSVSATAYYTRP